MVMGFQSSSLYVCSGQRPLDMFIIEPNDEVMTYFVSIDKRNFLEKRGSYDALDSRGILLDGAKDAGCADDGRVEKVLLDVCHVEMEGTGCVNHSFERRIRNNSVVKSIGLRDIWNDGKVEFVRSIAGMRLSNALGLAGAPDSRNYRMTGLIQLEEHI